MAEYEEAQPWDNTQVSEEEEEEAQAHFYSYEHIVNNLATLQEPDMEFSTLSSALTVVFDHFNDVHSDRALYTTILDKIGCQYEDSEACFAVVTPDGKYKGKEAIQLGLHNMAQVIGVLHMSFLKCKDVRASVRHGLTFDSEDLNVKLGELYYRQSAFTQRVLLDFDIVHPMASSSRVLLNKAMSMYQEHAAFYRFIDGALESMGKKAHRNTDMLFMIYFTIYQLSLKGYRVRGNIVYKQITIPKRKPVAQGTDDEGNPVYKCCFKDNIGQTCNVLRWEHRHPIKHLWTAKFDVSETETWNTHFWKPIDSTDFYGLEEATLEQFVYRVSSENGKAESIIMASSKVASDVQKYLVKSCSSMVKFLETMERTYACWNGILVSSKFYPYDELPSKFDNICVDKYFPKWYFYEEDERAMRGKPCASLLPTDMFREYKRPVQHRFDGFVQNLHCKMCGLPHDKVDHSKCGYHARASSSSSSSSAIPARWIVRCVVCKNDPSVCTCPGKVPTVYRIGGTRYLEIPTIHWDQLIMTQIRGMTISSPTEPGTQILLPPSEHKNTYRWATGIDFRPNFRIGPRVKAFEGEEETPGKTPFADCWRVANIKDGESNTGKTASADMVKIYLPDFGHLSDANQGKFMLEQCVEKGQFKPILMGEMGPNSLGRTMFCALVDATTVIPVSRKGISDVNAVCDRGITLLCNKFRLAGGDVEGSVKSRMAMLRYQVEVPAKKVDGMIHNRNANDPIPLARMGNWAYEDISSIHGHEHFAHVCPTVYMENRARFEETANPLRQFLNEPYSEKLGALVLDKDIYMLRKDLIEAYKEHCKLNGILKVAPWSDDNYNLRKVNIRPAPMGKIHDEEGNPTREKYMYGIAPMSDPTAMRILEEKQDDPLDPLDDDLDLDEGNSASTIVLMQKSLNSMDELEQTLQALMYCTDVTKPFIESLCAKLSTLNKVTQELEELTMVELE